MSASALPIFTAPNQSIGQAPLKSGPDARSTTSDNNFSRMFGQAQSKNQASRSSNSPAKKGGTEVPGGKALPPKAKSQESERPTSQAIPLSQGDKGSASQPAPVDTQVTATQGQARTTEPPEETKDASVSDQLAALGMTPAHSGPVMEEGGSLRDEAPSDLSFLLQEAVGKGWTADGEMDVPEMGADELHLGQRMSDTDLLPTVQRPEQGAGIEDALLETDAQQGPEISVDIQFDQAECSPQIQGQTQASRYQAQLRDDSQASMEAVEQRPVSERLEAGDSAEQSDHPPMNLDTELSSPIRERRPSHAPAQVQTQNQGREEVLSRPVETNEINETDEADTDTRPIQDRSAFFARMQTGSRRHRHEENEVAGDRSVDVPEQVATEQAQMQPQSQAIASPAQDQPQSTGVRLSRGQVGQMGADRTSGRAVAQHHTSEAKAPGLMLGGGFERSDEAETSTQEGTTEQAEGRMPETGSQEQVKNFSQLLNTGITRVQSEPLNAPRPQAAELPPHLRSLDTPVGSRAWDQGVGERIHWMIGNGLSSAEIRLNPQHLGPLEIRISLHNDQTQVSILAQHGATREALEASLPRLREMFQESNLNLGSVDVGRREAQTQQQGLNQQQGQGQEREREGKGRGFFDQREDEFAGDPMMGQRRRVSTALIDDFA